MNYTFPRVQGEESKNEGMKRMKENNHQLCEREHKNICGNFSCDFVWSQLPLWNKSFFAAVKLLKLFHLLHLSNSRPFYFQILGMINIQTISKWNHKHQKGELGLIEAKLQWHSIQLTYLEMQSLTRTLSMFSKIWTRQVSVYFRTKNQIVTNVVLELMPQFSGTETFPNCIFTFQGK